MIYVPLSEAASKCSAPPLAAMTILADYRNCYYKLGMQTGEEIDSQNVKVLDNDHTLKHLVLTGHDDGKVCVWSLQKFIVVLDDFKAPVTAMSKCFEGVAFGTAAGKIHFWDEFLYKPTKIIDITRGDWPFKTLSPLIVSIDYNQQRIMAATKNGDLIEINLKGDIQAHRINTLVRLTSPTSNALAILTQ